MHPLVLLLIVWLLCVLASWTIWRCLREHDAALEEEEEDDEEQQLERAPLLGPHARAAHEHLSALPLAPPPPFPEGCAQPAVAQAPVLRWLWGRRSGGVPAVAPVAVVHPSQPPAGPQPADEPHARGRSAVSRRSQGPAGGGSSSSLRESAATSRSRSRSGGSRRRAGSVRLGRRTPLDPEEEREMLARWRPRTPEVQAVPHSAHALAGYYLLPHAPAAAEKGGHAEEGAEERASECGWRMKAQQVARRRDQDARRASSASPTSPSGRVLVPHLVHRSRTYAAASAAAGAPTSTHQLLPPLERASTQPPVGSAVATPEGAVMLAVSVELDEARGARGAAGGMRAALAAAAEEQEEEEGGGAAAVAAGEAGRQWSSAADVHSLALLAAQQQQQRTVVSEQEVSSPLPQPERQPLMLRWPGAGEPSAAPPLSSMPIATAATPSRAAARALALLAPSPSAEPPAPAFGLLLATVDPGVPAPAAHGSSEPSAVAAVEEPEAPPAPTVPAFQALAHELERAPAPTPTPAAAAGATQQLRSVAGPSPLAAPPPPGGAPTTMHRSATAGSVASSSSGGATALRRTAAAAAAPSQALPPSASAASLPYPAAPAGPLPPPSPAVSSSAAAKMRGAGTQASSPVEGTKELGVLSMLLALPGGLTSPLAPGPGAGGGGVAAAAAPLEGQVGAPLGRSFAGGELEAARRGAGAAGLARGAAVAGGGAATPMRFGAARRAGAVPAVSIAGFQVAGCEEDVEVEDSGAAPSSV